MRKQAATDTWIRTTQTYTGRVQRTSQSIGPVGVAEPRFVHYEPTLFNSNDDQSSPDDLGDDDQLRGGSSADNR